MRKEFRSLRPAFQKWYFKTGFSKINSQNQLFIYLSIMGVGEGIQLLLNLL